MSEFQSYRGRTTLPAVSQRRYNAKECLLRAYGRVLEADVRWSVRFIRSNSSRRISMLQRGLVVRLTP